MEHLVKTTCTPCNAPRKEIVLQHSFPIYFHATLKLWNFVGKNTSLVKQTCVVCGCCRLRQFGWNISFCPQFPDMFKKWGRIFLEHFAGCLDHGVTAIFLVLTLQVPLDLALSETNRFFILRNYESLKWLKPPPLK